MKRMFGLMPSSEVEKSVTFRVNNDRKVSVDAGKNGWTIMYADHSTQYKDVVDTVENNLQMAIDLLKTQFDTVEEIENEDEKEIEKGEC